MDQVPGKLFMSMLTKNNYIKLKFKIFKHSNNYLKNVYSLHEFSDPGYSRGVSNLLRS